MRSLVAIVATILLPMILSAQQGGSTGVVAGTVLDSAQQPVDQAEVAIAALGLNTRTDSAGRFRLVGVSAGTHIVVARRIGYAATEVGVAIRQGEAIEVDFVLRVSTVPLSAVITEAEVFIPSFEEHRSRGFGTFLTRADLEKHEHRRLPDVLRQVRGAQIQNGKGYTAWLVSTRASQSRSIMSHTRQRRDEDDRLDGATEGACYAQVYLDNQILYRGEAHEPLFNLNTLHVHQIEAIEYYSGPSQLPLRYSGLNSPCGVLVIHTRRSIAPTRAPPDTKPEAMG